MLIYSSLPLPEWTYTEGFWLALISGHMLALMVPGFVAMFTEAPRLSWNLFGDMPGGLFSREDRQFPNGLQANVPADEQMLDHSPGQDEDRPLKAA